MKTKEWGPVYYRSPGAARRAAVRISDAFGCRVVVRRKWLRDGLDTGLYELIREDEEAKPELKQWYTDNGWDEYGIEDARLYNEDGTLRKENG